MFNAMSSRDPGYMTGMEGVSLGLVGVWGENGSKSDCSSQSNLDCNGGIQGDANSAYFIFHTGAIEPVLNDCCSM
jgi:hypothetical protein